LGNVIELRGVWKVYKMGEVDVPALRGVDLEVADGELLCIMGPSGSGKTTLLNVIAGLDAPTRGDVVVAGVDFSSLKGAELARFRLRNIGLVFQFHNLLPEFTAWENVAIPMLALSLPLEEARERSIDLLRELELEDKADRRPHQLSGGERQRVAVARALANNPKLIPADEPTGSLDLASKKAVMGLLRRVNEEAGVAVIVVSHDSLVASYAERVVRLVDGRVERE